MRRRLFRSRPLVIAAWLETVLQDILLTFRNLRREPAFAAIVIATLAIGVNTALFTLVNAILLTPLKVADAERLVRFVETPVGGAPSPLASLPITRLWLQQAGIFEDVRNVLTMRMSVSGTPFERQEGIARLTRQGLERISALAGVNAASTTCCMPLETVWQLPFVIQVGSKSMSSAMAGWTFVSPGYFDVFRIPVLRGRDFTEADDAASPGVVIFNQAMARRFWPDRDPLDDQLLIGRGVRPDYEADPLRPARPAMYVPISQVPDGVTVLNVRLLPLVWIARTNGNPYALAAPIERELQGASSGLPLARIRSMDDVVAESTARRRFDMLLMIVFASSALTLAAVGIFGLMGYSVQQRTQEIGVRLALGAGSPQVANMILRQGMALASIGIVIGVAVAFAFARLLAGLLFGVSPRDTLTFIAVPLTLGIVSLLAVAVPALRASRLTPMDALRHE